MRLKISILQVEQVTQKYVDWFSDNEVVKYSENQIENFHLKGNKYVASCLKNPSLDLYGIFDEDLHIGNIALSGINSVHRVAEITYVVGERLYWGKGVATFACKEIIKLAKSQLNSQSFAGVSEQNISSKRVLEKNKFVLEGRRIDHLYFQWDIPQSIRLWINFIKNLIN